MSNATLRDFDSLAPGSNKAVEQGCRCPVPDNGHGMGCGWTDDDQPLYIVDELCPLHAIRAKYQVANDPTLQEIDGVMGRIHGAGLTDGKVRVGRG